LWLIRNVHEELDVHEAHLLVTVCKKKTKQQKLTTDQNGKLEEQNIVESYTSENST
jgi:hypothetical protein